MTDYEEIPSEVLTEVVEESALAAADVVPAAEPEPASASASASAPGSSSPSLKMTPVAQYNPYSWRETLFVLRGRPFVDERLNPKPLLIVWGIGVGIVVLSALFGVILEENDRACRAWCSQFSLGPQPHAYIGVILFLLLAFRCNQAYRSYEAGLTAWTQIRREIMTFSASMLNMTPRDSISAHKRLRMLAFATAFPYALVADLREDRQFAPNTIDRYMQGRDLVEIKRASSMPLYCIESLLSMVRVYSGPEVPPGAIRNMYKSLHNLMTPFSTAERVKSNPVAFAYIAHLRLLLITYLVFLPLALVESLGWSTIPVFFVISYALMSLEVIAVEIENPFGGHKSDLRIDAYNEEISDLIGEMWRRWKRHLDDDQEELVSSYANQFDVRYPSSHYGYKFW